MPGQFILKIAVVCLLGSAILGQAPYGYSEDKGVQLPPPPDQGGGHDEHNDIMLEEEEDATLEKSASTQKGSHEAQKKSKEDHSKTEEHTANDAQPEHDGEPGHHQKEEKTGNFGESLVEAQVDAKSVSSGAGLIWFGAVFVVLIALIYFLT